ncbi:MAG: hypothetical protein F4X19_02225 [Acidobacteria bacterium]|nr:hypothetical protein [Acidobacteriota bacterium]
MTISQQEFEVILADDTKEIAQDLTWAEDEDHSPAREFRAAVASEHGYPLFVVGRYNYRSGTLSYALIHRRAGRIYALDLGADHHNPDCNRLGEKHKHRWAEGFRDKQAYVPEDITQPWHQPIEVWDQFCAEARIRHTGTMNPPVIQEEFSYE